MLDEVGRELHRAASKRWIDKNKEKIAAKRLASKETKSEYDKQRYNKNKPKVIAQVKEWASLHKPQLKEYKKHYSKNNRARLNALNNERKLADPNYKLKCDLRTRLCSAIRGNFKTGSAVKDLGCSIPELRKYIEGLFWPGMTWENRGKRGWQIDHITPLAAFNLEDREQLLGAVNYRNLQPLWKDDNRAKSNRLDWTPAESVHELPERFKNQY